MAETKTSFLSVEDVCEFLETRNISQNIVDFFRRQKMDGKVIELSSDEKLIEYGLVAIGDRITLRERCKTISNSGLPRPSAIESDSRQVGKCRKRKELLKLLRNNNKRDNTPNKVSFGRPKNNFRTVTFGLRLLKENLEADSDDERQASLVKSPLGDKNTIAFKLEIKSSYQEMLTVAKNPNGENPVLGSVDNFVVEIVNARNFNVEVGVSPFTFGEYLERKKIPGTPKLYVLCSPFNDDELEKSAFATDATDVVTYNTTTASTSTTFELNDHNVEEQNEQITEIATDDFPLIFETVSTEDNSFLLPETNYFQATSPSREVLIRINSQEPITKGITSEINEIVDNLIAEIKTKHICDPVEILRQYQIRIITGRPLDVEDEAIALKGETNFIMVDRSNIVQTGFSEIRNIENLRNTLEIQFYGEMAEDLGGPRKEFFSLILNGIKEAYFDPIREWSHDYDVIGKIFALSILQNGKLPRLFTPEEIESVFNENPSDKPFINQIRLGLNSLGLYKLACRVPVMLHLFTPGESKAINLKLITMLLKPVFSPEGSNQRRDESLIYSVFIQYLREAASGRRGNINLSNILKFVTGCEEEPVLGFSIQPSIHFSKTCGMFPTANTCINKLTMPLFEVMPEDTEIYNRLDYAFSNDYFGMI